MATTGETNDARLNFRLPCELKETIEQAATQLGQSISQFAVSTLVQRARDVIQECEVIKLSARDRDIFLAALEDTNRPPNERLMAAAAMYKEKIKRTAE